LSTGWLEISPLKVPSPPFPALALASIDLKWIESEIDGFE
jgi:hypothetical protein